MIELSEHATVVAEGPAPQQRIEVRTRRLLRNKIDVRWLAGDRVEIKASSWIGVVQLPTGQAIRVRPKLAGDELRVLVMLGVVNALPVDEIADLVRDLDDAPQDDARELLARLVVSTAHRVVATGLIRDYRPDTDDLPYLRGRLALRRQALRHFGRVEMLACAYEEFDQDVIENQIIVGALAVARRSLRHPVYRRRATQLHQQFQQFVSTRRPASVLVRTPVVYGRRNSHYRHAHTWSRALLEHGHLSDPLLAGGSEAPTFMIEMNVLFERFVESLVDRALNGSAATVQRQRRDATVIRSPRTRRSLIPDVLITMDGHNIPVDAKYKRYDGLDVSNSDIYQLLIYAQAYADESRMPTSVLVYPHEEAATSTSAFELVTGGRTRAVVRCIGIPLPRILQDLPVGATEAVDDTCASLRRAIGVGSGDGTAWSVGVGEAVQR